VDDTLQPKRVYHRPKTTEGAISLLERTSGAASLLAGGTDLLLRWESGSRARPDFILDLKHIKALKRISRVNGEIRIGACASMSDIEASSLIRSSAPALAKAAGHIACPQIRNRATIGGNLCNASPAADTAVPLLLMDAVIEIASRGPSGTASRKVPIAEFFTGPGSTVLSPAELLTFVHFRPQPRGVFADWEKLGTRPAMEIAVASVGLAIKLEDGVVTRARVAYGSVAPIPLRGLKAEAELAGKALSPAVIARCEAAAREEIKPISDVRASAAYRREIVAVLLRRMLERAGTS
jgi:CO/xanthine dehydrogenase FAD-binding subunit